MGRIALVLQHPNGSHIAVIKDYEGVVPVPGDVVMIRSNDKNVMMRVADRLVDVTGGATSDDPKGTVYDSHVYLHVVSVNSPARGIVVPSNNAVKKFVK